VQALNLEPGKRVLVVGDFTGYAGAVLKDMGVTLASDADESAVDAVLFVGAIGELLDTYTRRVIEGGRIAGVLTAPGEPGRATLWRKFAGDMTSITIFDAATPILPGFEKQPGFVF